MAYTKIVQKVLAIKITSLECALFLKICPQTRLSLPSLWIYTAFDRLDLFVINKFIPFLCIPIACEFVTVYVFQEPSLLSCLQDTGLTDVMLHALLIKDVRFTPLMKWIQMEQINYSNKSIVNRV